MAIVMKHALSWIAPTYERVRRTSSLSLERLKVQKVHNVHNSPISNTIDSNSIDNLNKKLSTETTGRDLFTIKAEMGFYTKANLENGNPRHVE